VATDGPTTDLRASLIEAIEAVATGADLEAALNGVLAAAAATSQSVMGAILVQDPDRPGLQVAATQGFDEAARERLALDAANAGDPFAQVVATRTSTFDRAGTMADGTAYVGAYLPLIVVTAGAEVALGTLGLGWPAPHALDASTRRHLEGLAALAAVAVDRARLSSTAAERSEWFERLAHSDPLTGLANERTVARLLELELARAARQGSEVSRAMFDVDGFQATNLSGGHQAGDEVLRRVAVVLAESVRLVDTVGRIGGDEFVLVAPGPAGVTVARRVLEGIRALPPIAGRPITVSAGVARFPVDGTDAESLIAAASAALARAREAGQDRIVAGAASEG
jgi:diguanylate cyclase (GGDEF)-like protein